VARLQAGGASLHTSVPVVLETFTFLDLHATRSVAFAFDAHFAAAGFRIAG
jgi:hypothetical protein